MKEMNSILTTYTFENKESIAVKVTDSMFLISKYADELIKYSQVYLKAEWERAKYESKTGKVHGYKFDKIFKELLEEYNNHNKSINNMNK